MHHTTTTTTTTTTSNAAAAAAAAIATTTHGHGRLNEIRKIIHALGESLFPVSNAFVIVLLIMCVYAILGVQLFKVSYDV